jgi:hypothetical protein
MGSGMEDHWSTEVEYIPHPVNVVAVPRRLRIERAMEQNIRTQPSVTVDRVCCICKELTTPGQSVLLTCECIVCRVCALNAILSSADTYHAGKLPCPNKQCSACISTAPTRLSLRNVSSLKKWENGLIESSAAYFGPLLPVYKRFNKQVLGLLLRWFKAFGYLDHASSSALTGASEARMRLRVATLEERRLNEAGLLRTMSSPVTDAEARFGFLRAADIPSDAVASSVPSGFEPTAGARSAASTIAAARTAVAERIEQGLQGLADAKESALGLSACNALEKLVWLAMTIHRDPSNSAWAYTFRTETEIQTATEVALLQIIRGFRPADSLAANISVSIPSLYKRRLLEYATIKRPSADQVTTEALGWCMVCSFEPVSSFICVCLSHRFHLMAPDSTRFAP